MNLVVYVCIHVSVAHGMRGEGASCRHRKLLSVPCHSTLNYCCTDIVGVKNSNYYLVSGRDPTECSICSVLKNASNGYPHDCGRCGCEHVIVKYCLFSCFPRTSCLYRNTKLWVCQDNHVSPCFALSEVRLALLWDLFIGSWHSWVCWVSELRRVPP